MKLNYTIVFVSDMARSVSFYRDVLGLPLKFESPHWTEFATAGATLALHKTNQASAPHSDHGERAGQCRPGLQVANLDEFHHRMLDNQVRCVRAPAEVFGARMAQYADPDGLTISFGEASSDESQ
jgi:lactoylglutathione lyase